MIPQSKLDLCRKYGGEPYRMHSREGVAFIRLNETPAHNGCHLGREKCLAEFVVNSIVNYNKFDIYAALFFKK